MFCVDDHFVIMLICDLFARQLHRLSVYCVIKISDLIIISVYMPYSGTFNRNELYNDLLRDAWSRREKYPNCNCIIDGDFNIDLDSVMQSRHYYYQYHF